MAGKGRRGTTTGKELDMAGKLEQPVVETGIVGLAVIGCHRLNAICTSITHEH